MIQTSSDGHIHLTVVVTNVSLTASGLNKNDGASKTPIRTFSQKRGVCITSDLWGLAYHFVEWRNM